MKIPHKITPTLAEETGWHIGDGSMNYYPRDYGKKKGLYSLRGHIIDDKPHYIERIKPLFKELYDIDVPIHEMPITNVFGFQVWNNQLVEFKQRLGLPLGPKTAITIPEIFLSDDNLKSSLLRGIFDTDGCVYLQPKYGKLYPRLEIVTISKSLAKQIQEAYLSFGLRATINERGYKNHPTWKSSYTITIRGDEMFHRFMQLIQSKNPKHIAKYIRYCDSLTKKTL